jgi:hypothetical protein
LIDIIRVIKALTEHLNTSNLKNSISKASINALFCPLYHLTKYT